MSIPKSSDLEIVTQDLGRNGKRGRETVWPLLPDTFLQRLIEAV